MKRWIVVKTVVYGQNGWDIDMVYSDVDDITVFKTRAAAKKYLDQVNADLKDHYWSDPTAGGALVGIHGDGWIVEHEYDEENLALSCEDGDNQVNYNVREITV